jgi:hypothetical protein
MPERLQMLPSIDHDCIGFSVASAAIPEEYHDDVKRAIHSKLENPG